ncbi:exosortase/archaeosortase family protein [Sedimentisphaera salicampi]|uniref:exosortase/archaeosortase family protein n=1 Tax=Sedimentisphaera salicampi TaxID=1941349 RepID=UPI000B9B1634|nr:exosortase/archaeosortase family protein [Sedimentisphaera salicampi]OXU14109.1 exosortase D, VPLPA-CTERM-specific [Sedimentisphaera salicampi]
MTEKVKYTWASLGSLFYLKTAVLAVLFVLLFWNNIEDMVRVWMKDPSWSHGFLIPLFSLYLINQRKEELLSKKASPSFIGVLTLAAILTVYIFNIVQIRYAYGEPVLMIAALGAVVLAVCGWRMIYHLWLPVAFLIFAVPIPTRLYRELTMPMRMIASQVTTAFLNAIPEIDATVRGVIIEVTYKGVPLETALNVADACSGMRLMMAFLALGVAMAYIHSRPIWQKATLIASIIPIAILCNIIRVTITAFIYIYIGQQYAKGIYHNMLGMMMLPIALFFYWLVDWFMNNLFEQEGEEEKQKEDDSPKVVRRKR